MSHPSTGAQYCMVPATAVESTDAQLQDLVSVCNETAIYDFLFRKKLGGAPYGVGDARSFLDWSARGWLNQTHFVFVILDSRDYLAGALDIKSSDRTSAEVGYWCSVNHRGLMSAAVGMLKTSAADAGYKSLFARVRADNPASIKVLERNGFTSDSTVTMEPGYLRFVTAL